MVRADVWLMAWVLLIGEFRLNERFRLKMVLLYQNGRSGYADG